MDESLDRVIAPMISAEGAMNAAIPEYLVRSAAPEVVEGERLRHTCLSEKLETRGVYGVAVVVDDGGDEVVVSAANRCDDAVVNIRCDDRTSDDWATRTARAVNRNGIRLLATTRMVNFAKTFHRTNKERPTNDGASKNMKYNKEYHKPVCFSTKDQLKVRPRLTQKTYEAGALKSTCTRLGHIGPQPSRFDASGPFQCFDFTLDSLAVSRVWDVRREPFIVHLIHQHKTVHAR